ncbi:DNA protecting protein DprA [Rhodothermaceae bacterium RA]|nr:DNA protecting protein DprA [Rhodothermaceae bacterium RA]
MPATCSVPSPGLPSLFDADTTDAPDEAREQRALVALSMVPGVGPGRVRALLARFGSAAVAMEAPLAALAEVPSIGPQTARAIRAFDAHAAVEAQLDQAARVGARLVASWDASFPRLLRQIYDPPSFLWMRGTLTDADDRAIAIVGTRRATDYGKRLAAEFAAELVRHGFTIVSGLAYGIDAAAHRAALDAGGRTLAVLGSGVDRIYPARHTRLARAITEQGALLSEYALGAKPDAVNFPRRNRIISGLTRGTLVVEAFETGGALITARLALEQNREVFALPSPAHSPAGRGANRLIQQGHAKLVLTVGDILDELGLAAPPPPSTPEATPPPPPLSGVERTLYDALTPQPQHIDALCLQTDLDPSTALVYLLNLEFKGLVRQMAGKQFYRA